MEAVDDAELFLEEAHDTDFTGMRRQELQTWMFRVKRELSGRYGYDAVGQEQDYEATLSAEEGTARFVVDRSADGVEVSAFVMADDGPVVDEVFRQP